MPSRHSLRRSLSYFSEHSFASRNARTGGAKSSFQNRSLRSTMGIIPIDGTTFVILALLFSLCFIFTVSCAFLGASEEDTYLKKTLNGIAGSDPGIVLFGESVDIDVDEPSITIRWSILACGQDFVLPGSAGVHRSDLCGLPASPLHIFVDNNADPVATYDPSQIPYNRETGERRSVQNLVQFDSDHVLDVHQARLYPFDTYLLSSTLRAAGFNNESVALRKLATVDETSSFQISIADIDSYVQTANGTQVPSRDMDMNIRRPASARAFTILLFGIGWMLTHISIANFFLAKMNADAKTMRKHLVFAFVILLALPQLRASMPDAPGLDGVLIDCIGFFPQLVLSGMSAIACLLIFMIRELDLNRESFPDSLPSMLNHSKQLSMALQLKHVAKPSTSTMTPPKESPGSRPLSTLSTIVESPLSPLPSTFNRPVSPLSSSKPRLKPLLLASGRTSSVDWRDSSSLHRSPMDEFVFPSPNAHRIQHRVQQSEGVD